MLLPCQGFAGCFAAGETRPTRYGKVDARAKLTGMTGSPERSRPGDAAPGGLRLRAFSTLGLPETEQFDAWRQELAGTLDLRRPDRAGFPAEYAAWRLGRLALKRSRAPASAYCRRAEHVRRDQIDHWALALVTSGEWRVRVEDGLEEPRRLGPGLPAVLRFDRPLEAERDDLDWLTLYVPRDAAPDLAHALDAAAGRPLRGPLGRLLAAHLATLPRQADALSETEAPLAEEATLGLLRAAVAGLPPEEMAAPLAGALRGRILGVVRGHLASARLTPAVLARLAGVSRSKLYRLFEPSGGVARAIQLERLRLARRALLDPADRRGIQRIAEAVGMPDHPAFSRAFRREFGCSPHELRLQAALGRAAGGGGAGPPNPNGPPASFADMLRRLGR